MLEYMAPTVGFEPTTDRLTADCSTARSTYNLPTSEENGSILALNLTEVKLTEATLPEKIRAEVCLFSQAASGIGRGRSGEK